MPDDKKQPIIIKKIKKGGHGHHGGSWKVAYADFVTAMMAFFLLLWLLGLTDETTRGGISDWFKNPSPVVGPGGASTSMIKLGGTKEVPRGDGEELNKKANTDEDIDKTEIKIIEIEEQKLFDLLMQQLKKKIENSPTLKDFKDQLLLEITPEGLRIQIVDRANRPMFSIGSAKLKPYTQDILRELAKVIKQHVKNKLSITGHTDATRYGRGWVEYETVDGEVIRKQYSNWDLSAERANAARLALMKGGIPETQIARVVGLSSTVLFDKANPVNPANRRISLIVMNRSAMESIEKSEGSVESLKAVPDVKLENIQ